MRSNCFSMQRPIGYEVADKCRTQIIRESKSRAMQNLTEVDGCQPIQKCKGVMECHTAGHQSKGLAANEFCHASVMARV
eukprot:4363771-Amphidinium_carterae.2